MKTHMNPTIALKHEFVEYIPSDLAEGTLYVSMAFATVVHKCCCGCGREVVTPLSPTDWELTFDGRSISLYPSIGNWDYPCRSHYWIKNDLVEWAPPWSKEEIEAGRAADGLAKERYFQRKHDNLSSVPTTPTAPAAQETRNRQENRWQKLKRWFIG
jgi:Family of unknown function (DUF6527)